MPPRPHTVRPTYLFLALAANQVQRLDPRPASAIAPSVVRTNTPLLSRNFTSKLTGGGGNQAAAVAPITPESRADIETTAGGTFRPRSVGITADTY